MSQSRKLVKSIAIRKGKFGRTTSVATRRNPYFLERNAVESSNKSVTGVKFSGDKRWAMDKL